MIDEVKLLKLTYLPISLDEGILYVSKKYAVAGHLCPCGCGSKIITPLGQTEWSLKINKGKPSLYPSIGNWQLPCKSHYWIIEGTIVWSNRWTEEKIKAGWEAENDRRIEYFNSSLTKRLRRYFRRL